MPSSGGTTFAQLSGSNAAGSAESGSTTSGTSGSFPQGQTASELLLSLGIDSTDVGNYTTNGGQDLNAQGQALVDYMDAPEAERQQLQQQLANAGFLPTTDVNGQVSTTSTEAFAKVLGLATASGKTVNDYLAELGAGTVNQQGTLGPSTGATQGQISSNLEEAQKEATAPVEVELENPSTLTQDITTAFDNALGYAPSAEQINAFIAGVHKQDTAQADVGRTAAQDEINQAKSEESALNKLGTDGIDSFVSAYAAAIHGTDVTGAGTSKGPQTGTTTVNGQPLSMIPGMPTLPLPTEKLVQGKATKQPVFSKAATESFQPGASGGVDLQSGQIVPAGTQTGTREVTPPPTTVTTGHFAAPGKIGGGSVAIHGGVYALSPNLWKEAQALTPAAKKYASAGQAPLSIQQSAFTNLSASLYDKSGSWSDVAIELAGGTPGKSATTSGSVLPGAKTNVQNFAEGVASTVNKQIQTVQNQVNNSPITVRETTPDAEAEASLAAKQADPVGYYAANYATGADLLNQMLAGAPEMYGYSTTDTFSGPVGAAEVSPPASTASGPTPAAA